MLVLINKQYKKTIKELVVKYRREPEIHDIYVEGRRDYDFVEWIFEKIGVKNIKIYKIETVEISEGYFPEKNLILKKNNRNKIIFLAYNLELRKISKSQVRCFIDSDFDYVLKKVCKSKLLLFTDYTCIEMYLFNEKTLDKYLKMNLGGFPHSSNHILKQLSKVLPGLFLIRLTNEIMGLKMTWINLRKYCSLNKNKLYFNTKKFIKSYLNSNSNYSKLNEFLALVETFKENLTDDPRRQIHRDDFLELLSFYIHKYGKKTLKLCNPEILDGSLFGCVEKDHIENEKLFKTLEEWALTRKIL